MEPVRPLRDLFDDLANRPSGIPDGDPAAALPDAGHADLPGDLVAEALVSYAATAPPQVAERLGPYVTAHSGVPAATDPDPVDLPDPAQGLGLLTGAAGGDWEDPLGLDSGPAGDLPDLPDLPADGLPDGLPDGATDAWTDLPGTAPDHGFGTGAGHDDADLDQIDGLPASPVTGDWPAADLAGSAEPLPDEESGEFGSGGFEPGGFEPDGFGTGWSEPVDGADGEAADDGRPEGQAENLDD